MNDKKRRLVVDKDGWVLMEAGHWAKTVEGTVFHIEYWSEEKKWFCRENLGDYFDCARTLKEAKTYCRTAS